MGSERRAAGILALVALSFVVTAMWMAAQGGGLDLGTFGGAREGTADAAATGGDGTATAGGDGAGQAGAASKRPPRKRAYVRTEEDVRRDAAREALVAAVTQAATNVGAANVRPMVLPGTPTATPADWPGTSVRLGASVPTAAALALDADPGRRDRRVQATALAHLGYVGRDRPTPRARRGDIDPWGNPLAQSTSGGDGAAPDDPPPDPRHHGLRADYYDFLEGGLTDVPDMTALPPTLTRVDPAIDFPTDDSFALPFDPETFGALWRGYLVVDVAGEYEFTIGSDDGARLRLDGADVVVFPYLRPYGESSGRVHLDAGRHPLEVGFYENYVFASCRLFWKPPGAAARTIVPASAFEPPDEIAAVDPPWVGSVTPPDARIGDQVTITGGGFSATPALERVTFAGVPAEIVSASPTELVVKVPIGASTGNLVVQVGPLSTRPWPFEVDNLLGLYGEYFLIGTEIQDLPDFDVIAPYFVRLDGPLDFTEDDQWQMPYEPDTFAARWFGFLYVPEEDQYEITLRSDDGAFVAIDGTRVVDLPGLHPPIEAASVVGLSAGFHPIELRFFENYGLARLSLYWRRRGEPTRAPIPRGFFFAPDALAQRVAPQVTSLAPATAVSGDEIVVRGAAFGSDARVVRVEFPGDVWARPSVASEDTLTVRVPFGAGTGPVRVHVGVLTSGDVEFTLGEPVGLKGEYFELSAGEATKATDLPALLAARSPSVTRTDTRWRFGKREDWNLPFVSRDFAVHWSGTVCVETAQHLQVALQSESAALLRVDGWDVVSDPDPHTLQERYGVGRLTPGEHSIELWSLHVSGSDPRLNVFVTPYGRADHFEFPPTWLRPRAPR